MGEPPSEEFRVETMPLDALAGRLDGRVDFIKIDVERMEPLVLAGAEQIMRDNPNLTIVMEWSPGQMRTAGFDVPDFMERMKQRGFRSHSIVPGGIKAVTIGELLNIGYQAGIVLKR